MRQPTSLPSHATLVALTFCLLPCAAWAHSAGIAGYSGMSTKTCTSCHSDGATPTVAIQGPSTLAPGATGSYTVQVTGGPGKAAGIDVAVNSGGTLAVASSSTTKLLSSELVHSSPLAFSNGSASFAFSVVAPSTAGTLTLYAAGLSTNGDGDTSGDGTAATTFQVTISGGSGGGGGGGGSGGPVGTPAIVEPAAALPSVVTGTTTSLSALGVGTSSSSSLTYTWAATSGTGVTFNPNGTAASNNSTATFTAAGTYTIQVTALDASNGQNSTSSCSVTVQSISGSVIVNPAVATVQVSGTQQFSAQVDDQFGALMTSMTGLSWSTSGGGSVNESGLFTAGSSAGGPYTVQGGSATATVTISAGLPPQIVTPEFVNTLQVTGTNASVQIEGTDALGGSDLTYTWSVVDGAPVSFSPNGTSNANASVANFTSAGNYTLQVVTADSAGNGSSTTMRVAVQAVPNGLGIATNGGVANVAPNGTYAFSASTVDQFGNPINAVSDLTWSVSGGGTINPYGLFTAGSATGGPFVVTASGNGYQTSTSFTVGAPQHAQGFMKTTQTAGCSVSGGGFNPAALYLIALSVVIAARRRGRAS